MSELTLDPMHPAIGPGWLRAQISQAFAKRHDVMGTAQRAMLRHFIATWIMELDVLTGNEDRLHRHLRGLA